MSIFDDAPDYREDGTFWPRLICAIFLLGYWAARLSGADPFPVPDLNRERRQVHGEAH